jgi:uncharacterized protein YlzI (FlbEa/FlbD family)
VRVKIVMDSGKEYIVESTESTIDQFVWMNFEKKNALINHFVKLRFEDNDILLNPSHISSLEEVHG